MAISLKSFATSKNRRLFADHLQGWFNTAMRPLPWRTTYDPYSVWISEIMLQQTQMDRGVAYFNTWMQRFPSIPHVANAPIQDILSAWEGLGYYSRARNLHAAAKFIMSAHNGSFPTTIDDIRRLPGIGEYTAGAIASIAFNLPEPAVDANVLRIFARILDIDSPITNTTTKTLVTQTVRTLMPQNSPRLFNQALMELGALICGKTPHCTQCPIHDFCAALAHNTVASRPIKKEKQPYRSIEAVTAIIVADNRVLVRQRPPVGLWAGMWEFPTSELPPASSPEPTIIQFIKETTDLDISIQQKLPIVRHSYTTNRVTLHAYTCTPSTTTSTLPPNITWSPIKSISTLPLPSGHRKLRSLMGWDKNPITKKKKQRKP